MACGPELLARFGFAEFWCGSHGRRYLTGWDQRVETDPTATPSDHSDTHHPSIHPFIIHSFTYSAPATLPSGICQYRIQLFQGTYCQNLLLEPSDPRYLRYSSNTICNSARHVHCITLPSSSVVTFRVSAPNRDHHTTTAFAAPITASHRHPAKEKHLLFTTSHLLLSRCSTCISLNCHLLHPFHHASVLPTVRAFTLIHDLLIAQRNGRREEHWVIPDPAAA